MYPQVSTCLDCPAGRTSTNGATTCGDCPIGSISRSGDDECQVCEAGTYAQTSICLSCEAGKYSNFSAAVCENCAAGTKSSSRSAVCDACEAGTFQAFGGSSTCIECALEVQGSTTVTPGASSDRECVCLESSYHDTDLGECRDIATLSTDSEPPVDPLKPGMTTQTLDLRKDFWRPTINSTMIYR